MAKYTVTIKSLIDNNFNFGLDSYPIFDENYRSTLNNNILNHYYVYEIGFETANLFKFYLNQTLTEIMPAYNVLYLAQKHLIDNNLLFNNVNITENLQGADSSSSSLSSDVNSSNTSTSSNSGSSSSSSSNTGSGSSKSLFQDTPQGQLSNTDINSPSWATNLTLGSNSSSNSITDSSSQSSQYSDTSYSASRASNSSSSSSNNSYIKSIVGNNGAISNIEILNLIANNFYNIDSKVIHDLRDLFMIVF